MPGIGGLEVVAELRRKGMLMPVIFITGHGSIPLSCRR